MNVLVSHSTAPGVPGRSALRDVVGRLPGPAHGDVVAQQSKIMSLSAAFNTPSIVKLPATKPRSPVRDGFGDDPVLVDRPYDAVAQFGGPEERRRKRAQRPRFVARPLNHRAPTRVRRQIGVGSVFELHKRMCLKGIFIAPLRNSDEDNILKRALRRVIPVNGINRSA